MRVRGAQDDAGSCPVLCNAASQDTNPMGWNGGKGEAAAGA